MQIIHQGFKAARLDPALGLLVDRCPRRQIIGNHPPWTDGAYHVALPIEYGTHRVLPLGRTLDHQRQVGGDKGPLFIRNITGTPICIAHFPSLRDFYRKFMTGESGPQLIVFDYSRFCNSCQSVFGVLNWQTRSDY